MGSKTRTVVHQGVLGSLYAGNGVFLSPPYLWSRNWEMQVIERMMLKKHFHRQSAPNLKKREGHLLQNENRRNIGYVHLVEG